MAGLEYQGQSNAFESMPLRAIPDHDLPSFGQPAGKKAMRVGNPEK
jgi:hypothetical protein